MAFAWFPSEQWAGALQRWPDLLEDNPQGHAAYSRKIQGTLLRFASVSANPPSVAGLDVDGLIEYSRRLGYDPGSSAARSAYAAELARTGRVLPWPPGRNETVLVWIGTEVQGVLRNRAPAGGGVTARMWLSVRVELIEGRGAPS